MGNSVSDGQGQQNQIQNLRHINLGRTDLGALTKAFGRKLNLELRGDQDLAAAHLPFDLSDRSSEDLLNKISDGVILCKLVNKIEPRSIEERLIHKRSGIDVHQKAENVRRALDHLQTLNVDITKINSEEVVARRELAVLEALWCTIRQLVLLNVTLEKRPELVCVMDEEEQLHDFMKQPPEVILIRWLNWHLIRAQRPKSSLHNTADENTRSYGPLITVENYGSHLKDSVAFGLLLKRIYQFMGRVDDRISSLVLNPANLLKDRMEARAKTVLELAREIGVPVFIEAADICAGDERLNLMFLSSIFSHCQGIYLTDDGYDENDVGDAEKLSSKATVVVGKSTTTAVVAVELQPTEKTNEYDYAGLTEEEFNCRIDELLGPNAVAIRMELEEAKLRKDDRLANGDDENNSREYVEESAEVRREEEVFRLWINSRKFRDLRITNLFSDMEDGVSLLRLIEQIEPGAVDWKRVTLDANSRFTKIENANYAVHLAKALNVSVVNIGGTDIVDGNKKMVLALTFQLMRKFTLRTLTTLAAREGVKELTEDHVVQWANQKVTSSGKTRTMSSLRDPSLKSGLFFADLVSSIWKDAVDWSKVTQGEDFDEQLDNARYTLALVRAKGVLVFTTAESLVAGGIKMLLGFLASLWEAELKERRAG